jgi:hypothetical protein
MRREIKLKSVLTALILIATQWVQANPGVRGSVEAGAKAVEAARGALHLKGRVKELPVSNVKPPVSSMPLVTLPSPVQSSPVGNSQITNQSGVGAVLESDSKKIQVDARATTSSKAKLAVLRDNFVSTVETRLTAGDISSAEAETLIRAFDLGVFKNANCVKLSAESVRNLSGVTAYVNKQLDALGTSLFAVNEAGLGAAAEQWVTGMINVIGQTREEAIEKTVGLSESCGLSDRLGRMAAALN